MTAIAETRASSSDVLNLRRFPSRKFLSHVAGRSRFNTAIVVLNPPSGPENLNSDTRAAQAVLHFMYMYSGGAVRLVQCT
jgi:hypothetical protein